MIVAVTDLLPSIVTVHAPVPVHAPLQPAKAPLPLVLAVSVTVLLADGRLRALVEDDGKGFDPAAPRSGRHLGVAGMIERSELVGGVLTVDSRPGHGATIRLEVPIE